MASHTQLRNVTEAGSSLLSDQLEANLVGFFQWGSLGIGAFANVLIGVTPPYGGNAARLRLSENPNFTAGQRWEGHRRDWVWESGVEYTSQPIQISGVYVNGGFHASSSTGTYAHTIDYVNGGVIFALPIPASSVVTCERSHRTWHWTTADTPWWREFQANSYRVDDPHFLQTGSGAWATLSQSRVQLPVVVVEVVPNTHRIPKEIGNSTAIVSQDALFHIVSETRWDVKTLHDIVTYQWQQRINGFDKNLIGADNAFPLTANYDRASGAKMYPDLIKPVDQGGYLWKQIRFTQMRSSELFTKNNEVFQHESPLYSTSVRGTFEVDI